MADQKISELTALTGANVADDDAIAIVDTSATETKKIVFSELKNALDTATGFVRITGDTMTGALTTTGLTVESNTGAIAKIGRSDTAIALNDVLGQLDFTTNDASTTEPIRGQVKVISDGTSGNSSLYISTASSNTLSNRIKVGFDGDISFYEDTGTTPKFFWSAADERLGIGTSLPDRPVHLSSAGTRNYFKAETTGSANSSESGFEIKTPSSNWLINSLGATDALIFYDLGNTSEAMRIDSSGNVGIGTTATTMGKTNISLAGVAVTGDTDGATIGAGGILNLLNSNGGVTNSTTMLLGSTGSSAVGQIASGIGFTRESSGHWGTQLRFYTHSTSTSDLDELNEAMRIDSSGNVGIGTSPAANRALHVSSTPQNQARFERIGSATSHIEFSDSTTTNEPSLGSVGDTLTFHTAFTPRMIIDSSGNVGIGATPSEKLTVAGNIVTSVDNSIIAPYASLLGFVKKSGTAGSIAYASGQSLIFSQSSAAALSDPSSETYTEHMRIDSSGNITAPTTAAFLATPASVQSNIPINTTTTIVLGTEVFDQGSNFASNTFTAPVTGKYQLCLQVGIQNLDTATAYYQLDIVTSNRTYQFLYDPTERTGDVTYATFNVSALADMDASDTAFARLYIPNSGAAQADVNTGTFFSGFLAC